MRDDSWYIGGWNGLGWCAWGVDDGCIWMRVVDAHGGYAWRCDVKEWIWEGI